MFLASWVYSRHNYILKFYPHNKICCEWTGMWYWVFWFSAVLAVVWDVPLWWILSFYPDRFTTSPSFSWLYKSVFLHLFWVILLRTDKSECLACKYNCAQWCSHCLCHLFLWSMTSASRRIIHLHIWASYKKHHSVMSPHEYKFS